jgi:hypothetical protein
MIGLAGVLAGKRVEDAVLDLADLKRGPLQGSLFLRDERFAPLEQRPLVVLR